MVPSRDQCAPQSERTDALLQQSQQPQSRIGHAKSDCPLHQARESSSLSAIHRARHTASLATLRVLCCDHQALTESQQVIRHRLVRLPPCFAIWRHRHPRSLFFCCRFFSRIPGPPPFSSMNSNNQALLACLELEQSKLNSTTYEIYRPSQFV